MAQIKGRQIEIRKEKIPIKEGMTASQLKEKCSRSGKPISDGAARWKGRHSRRGGPGSAMVDGESPVSRARRVCREGGGGGIRLDGKGGETKDPGRRGFERAENDAMGFRNGQDAESVPRARASPREKEKERPIVIRVS